MSQGLQIWDASGRMILDLTTRLTRIEGVIDTGTSDGRFVLPAASGTAFIVVQDNSEIFTRRGPGVWLDGNAILWKFSTEQYAPQPRASYKVRYGFF